VNEEITTTLRPDRSSPEAFAAHVLALHRAIDLVPEGALRLGELRLQASPLDASQPVRSGAVLAGDRAVAEVHDTLGATGDVIGTNVRGSW
jgi:hypothetical protein